MIAQCRGCGLMLRVNLRVVARVKGRRFSLWSRKARCRPIGCQGWTVFQARAPGMHYHAPLEAPWPPGKPSKPGG